MHLHSILTLLSIASTVHAIPTIIPGRSTQNLHPRAEGFNVVFYDSATCAYEGITHGGIQPPTYGIEISGCQKYDPGTASFQALKPAVALKNSCELWGYKEANCGGTETILEVGTCYLATEWEGGVKLACPNQVRYTVRSDVEAELPYEL